MKYPNGNSISLGDRVKLSNGELGTIVFSIDTDEYTEEFKKEEWEYLKNGVMVKTDEGTLIHYENKNIEALFPANEN